MFIHDSKFNSSPSLSLHLYMDPYLSKIQVEFYHGKYWVDCIDLLPKKTPIPFFSMINL